MLTLKEGFLHLPVQILDEVVQPGVQCQIAGVQAVGTGFHILRPFLLHGNQAVTECVQFSGGRQNPDGFLGAQRSQYIVPSFPHGAYAGGTFRHFGQMVDKQTVSSILYPDGFHDTEQVHFLVGKQVPERVYLFGTYMLPAPGLRGQQQAVCGQPFLAIVCRICIFLADQALAQQGKLGDVKVCGMDVIPYRLQVMHFEIYLPHPATLTKEDNHHSDYGGQQQEVPGIYLLCQGYFHC